MSFGFSVGDFIAIAQLASSIRKQFIDAPAQFKAISDESVALAGTLRVLIFDLIESRASRMPFVMLKTSYPSRNSHPSSRPSHAI
jgi:hypothetical protein